MILLYQSIQAYCPLDYIQHFYDLLKVLLLLYKRVNFQSIANDLDNKLCIGVRLHI